MKFPKHNLSQNMISLFRKAPDNWRNLPVGIGCTNSTLNALESRGLIATKIGKFVPQGFSQWQWQLTAAGRQWLKDHPRYKP